jgi:mannosyltransferase OCH1-like enzyme
MKIQAKIYIDYFNHMHDNDLHKRMFYYAFAFACSNEKEKAISAFEKLLIEKTLEDGLKNVVKTNLENLYGSALSPIPKIIHIIYFKVRDLEEYNYRCIASMAHHMPGYKILVHNDIEPVGNQWWDKIKSIKTVEIHHMDRPSHFDGLALHHVQYQADVTRLDVLYEQGGVYLDLDMLILQNFEKVFQTGKDFYISCEGPKDENGKVSLINSFLASKPKNEFIKHWLEGFKSGLRMENWAYHIRDTNRIILENNPHFMYKYRIEILDHKHFFPLLWTDYDAFHNRRKVEFGDDSYGVHLFDTIHHGTLVKNEFLPDVPSDFQDVHA